MMLNSALNNYRCVSAALIALACLCTTPAVAQGELTIVALVNDVPISAYDVVQRVRFVAATSRTQPTEAMRKKAIDDLINESLQLQEAKKQNIIVTDDQINNAINNIAKRNNMTGEQMTQAMAQLGVNPATFKTRLRASISWQKVVTLKFSRQVRVSSTQVEKAMGGKGGINIGKTEFELQRVSLKVTSGADQATVTARLVEAEELRAKFQSCASISELVGHVSSASVKSLGKKTADQIAQPSRALLLNASAGQMTPAAVTSTGIELYAVCARRAIEGSDPQKRKTVENKLRQQELVRRSKSFIRDLRQDAYIEIR